MAKSLFTLNKADKETQEQIRKVVCFGKMPRQAQPNSGLFSLYFKEDSFELELTERYLKFRPGARTQLTYQLPLYYVDNVIFRRKQLVESAGITDEKGRLELMMQYARLPLIDPPKLKNLSEEILAASDRAKAFLVGQRDPQAMYDMFLYDLCDYPITFVQPDWDNGFIRLKARIQRPPSVNLETAKTKKGKANYIRDYFETIASDACRYAITAFDRLQSLEAIEITLARMEAEPVEGVSVERELELTRPKWQLKKNEFGRVEGEAPALQDKAKKVKLSPEEKKAQKLLAAEEKKKRKFVRATSYQNASDELFDGTLRHESVLLSVRISRPAFRELLRSRDSYTAAYAVKLFNPNLRYDEEEGVIFPSESLF